jgi:hypothetical protein
MVEFNKPRRKEVLKVSVAHKKSFTLLLINQAASPVEMNRAKTAFIAHSKKKR